jgi:hypothetical protein
LSSVRRSQSGVRSRPLPPPAGAARSPHDHTGHESRGAPAGGGRGRERTPDCERRTLDKPGAGARQRVRSATPMRSSWRAGRGRRRRCLGCLQPPQLRALPARAVSFPMSRCSSRASAGKRGKQGTEVKRSKLYTNSDDAWAEHNARVAATPAPPDDAMLLLARWIALAWRL